MSRVGHARPAIASTLALMALLDGTARLGGLARAMRMAERLGGRHVGKTVVAAPDEVIEACMRAVLLSAAFYPRRALCLEQSLALFVLLRRRGIDALLRIGVQTIPFSAHAWVEVDGVAVNERQGHIEQLATFQHAGT